HRFMRSSYPRGPASVIGRDDLCHGDPWPAAACQILRCPYAETTVSKVSFDRGQEPLTARRVRVRAAGGLPSASRTQSPDSADAPPHPYDHYDQQLPSSPIRSVNVGE